MSIRLLIVSTLDSQEPFGAFTRPFYLGMYLSQHFEVCQLGLDCSSVDYAKAVSIHSRGLGDYIKALRQCIREFQPDIIYAQETLPGIASLIACRFSDRPKGQNRPKLVFDFHTLSAYEYWTRLPSAPKRLPVVKQLVKTYIAQGILALSGHPIIAAGNPVLKGIKDWYKVSGRRIYCVGNGVPEDLLTAPDAQDPYEKLRPAKIVVVVAPKTFQFPTNDMSVDMTLDIARHLSENSSDVHFVIVGRSQQDQSGDIPANVAFAGFLPSRSDFLAHLHYADISLLPFQKDAVAGGARNKALDSLACENLVVSTPEGMRGLEAFEHERHLLIAGYETGAIAQVISEAAQNLNAYRPLIEASSQRIKNEYSWRAIAEKVAAILHAVGSP